MGWWRTGHDDDIIGDDAADTIIEALQLQEEMEGQKPTFQELLDATANVVRYDGESFLSDPESLADGELEAVFAPPAPPLRSQPTLSTPLTSHLLRAFEAIAAQYLETDHARKPRLREILAALAFVLRPEPRQVLREVEGRQLIELRVATESS